MKRYRTLANAVASLILASAPALHAASANLGSVAVAHSGTTTVTVTITAAGTLSKIAVLTQGAAGLDFTAAEGGTCTAGAAYAAKSTCTVAVAFAPRYTGVRYGAVQLTDATQKVLATTYLQGNGLGPQLVFPLGYVPPTPSVLCGAGSEPQSIALDGRGNAFVSTYGHIFEYSPFAEAGAGSNCNDSTFLDLQALRLAVDGAGNLYICQGNILKETLLPDGTYAESILGSGIASSYGVAVDGSGNVYVAGFAIAENSPTVFKETLQPDGSYVQTTIGSGWSAPYGVAVDAKGNLYVADYGTGNAYKETPSANGPTGYVQSPVVTGYSQLDNIAVDSAGNVYLVDADPSFTQIQGSGIHEEIPQPDGSYSEIVLPIVYNGSSLTSIAFDGAYNQYLTDQYDDGAYKLDLAAPPSLLTFASGLNGLKAIYGANLVGIANAGNEPLSMEAIDYPADFTAFTPEQSYFCKANTVLAPGTGCAIAIQFAPKTPLVPPATSRVLNENLQFTANHLNARTTYTLALTGTQIQPTATTPVIAIPSGTYSKPLSVAISDATPGATVYYNIGTTIPNQSATKYTGPISVTKTETIVAVAYAAGFTPSNRAVANYVINAVTAPPVLSLASGTYKSLQTLKIADATPGAIVYYTLNGATPTTASAKYTGPVTLKSSATLRAIAIAPGYQPSAAVSAAYLFVAANPVFSPAGGTYSSAQTVSIASATPTALVFYTTNGALPSASSTRYTGPFKVATSQHIKAIAIETGFTPSTVVEQDYVVK